MIANPLGQHGGFFGGLGGRMRRAIALIARLLGSRKPTRLPRVVEDKRLALPQAIPEGALSPLHQLNQNDAIIARLQAVSRQAKTDLKIREEAARAEENPAALRAGYYMAEMQKESPRPKPVRQAEAKLRAQARAQQTIAQRREDRAQQHEREKSNLVNLELAKIAQEAEAARQAEIHATRLANLKKARAAKRRKSRKK